MRGRGADRGGSGRIDGTAPATAHKLGEVRFLAPLNDGCVTSARDPRDGRHVLYASFYSSDPQHPPALARIDFERHECSSYPQPAGRGAWRILQASNGRLWFGMNGPGQLACFDPARERFEAVPAHALPKRTSHLADLVEGPDGRIYASTCPSSMVVVYDPATQRYRAHTIGDGKGHLYALAWLDDGRLLTANGLQHAVWAVHPETGRAELRTPQQLLNRADAWSRFLRWRDELLLVLTAGDSAVEVVRHRADTGEFIGSARLAVPTSLGCALFSDDGERVFLGVDGGRILRVDLDRGLAEPAYRIADVPTRVPLYCFLDSDRILVTSNTQYYGIYHVSKGRLDLHVAEVTTPAIDIFSIMPHSRGGIYCTSSLGLCLARFDLEKGHSEMLGITANASGEIYGNAESADGRIYGVSYTDAVLTTYDPGRPWSPGAEASSNPRSLGPLGEQQYRPKTGVLKGPGGRLCVGTLPSYGARGGALTVMDPATDTWVVHRHIVRDHSVVGLAADERWVFVGTTVQADGYLKPLDEDAHFLIFDPEAGRVVRDLPVKEAQSVQTMGCSGAWVYFWSISTRNTCRMWRYGLATGTLEPAPGDVRLNGVSYRPMARTSDGMLWFGHAGGLARIEPGSGEVRQVWTSPAPWAGPFAAWGRDLLFADGAELYLLRDGWFTEGRSSWARARAFGPERGHCIS